MNKIYLENCLDTMNKITYNYIFCVPPDYDELNLQPVRNDAEYYRFLEDVFGMFNPQENIVTIAITDRKFGGGILPKHDEIIKIMTNLKYKYISQKIWCKSYKVNLYRLNYAFVMSFAKEPYSQSHYKEYEPDVWYHKVYRHKNYNFAISLDVVKNCILNFTIEKDVVFDPFMGSGTTAIACLETNRQYLGSEVDKDTYELAEDRIRKYLNEPKQELLPLNLGEEKEE